MHFILKEPFMDIMQNMKDRVLCNKFYVYVNWIWDYIGERKTLDK